jgi:Terminase large subunit, T4likevirus-type, N-terminal
MRKCNGEESILNLTPCQWEVFNSQARFRVLVAGRRFGKTHLAIAEMLREAQNPDRIIWYVGPTDRQSQRIVWDRLKTAARAHGFKSANETNKRIDFKTGSVIVVNGAFHPDSLRGTGLDFIVLDEFASIKPQAWTEVFRPALADRQGRALFIGTPKGRNHFYERFEFAKNDPDWQAFHFTTVQGGIVHEQELHSAGRDLDPESFRQEFNAEFVSTNRNRVYYTFTPSRHIRQLSFEPLHDLIWSIDFNVDPMTMLLIQRIEDIVYVIDEIVLRDANTEAACQAFLDRIEPLYKQVPTYQRPLEINIYGDSSGNHRRTSGSETDWQIIRHVMSKWKGQYQPSIRTTASNPPVRDRVNCVNRQLHSNSDEDRLFINTTCRELAKDLDQVAWAIDGTGAATSEIDKSDKARTHSSDALGYYIVRAFSLKPPIGHNGSGRIV